MQPVINRRIREKSNVPVIEPPISDDDRHIQINIGRSGQRDAVFAQIDLVLDRIEFDLHDLM